MRGFLRIVGRFVQGFVERIVFYAEEATFGVYHVAEIMVDEFASFACGEDVRIFWGDARDIAG
jgi:hypothetical protein